MFIPGTDDMDESLALPPSQEVGDLLLMSQIASQYARGVPVYIIADNFNLSPHEVQLRIAHTLAQHRNALTHDVAALKARELLKIEELERQYWLAWENSLTPQEFQEDIQILLANLEGQLLPSTTLPSRRKNQTRPGRASTLYLQGVERCIKMRLEILELLTPPPTSPLINLTFNSGLTSDERLNKLSTLLTAAPQGIKEKVAQLLAAQPAQVIEAE